MFKQLAQLFAGGAKDLVRLHPLNLTALLELAWHLSAPRPNGDAERRARIDALLGTCEKLWGGSNIGIQSPEQASQTLRNVFAQHLAGVRGHHLIYAYMIENTRVYEIFRRVLHEFRHGERLGVPSEESQQWLRNTEELFFRDPPPFSVTTVSSHIRPDLRASRRNAYQRMFGMDLNHGTDDGQPYPYIRADAANKEFVTTFEELLREVWVGMMHIDASAAPKLTDDGKIADLAKSLHDMLTSRRSGGNLAREEFVFVAMMSWFHMTVESKLAILDDLKATASGAEQRLFQIAERVGLPAHGLSRSYFEIAEAMSRILLAIEKGTYNTADDVIQLYKKGEPYPVDTLPTPPPPPDLPRFTPEGDMRTIITHWSVITGRDVKAGKVSQVREKSLLVTVPTIPAAGAVRANGHGAVLV